MSLPDPIADLQDFIDVLRNSLPVPEIPKKTVIDRPEGTLYNIHKRSIPPALDKIVVIGVSRIEALKEIDRLLLKECKRRNLEGYEPSYYFDIVPMEASAFEKSIYYNEGQVTI